MHTECSQLAFEFQSLGGRQVVADFAGGTITSDAGGLLLREVEARTGLLAKLAGCFDDYRDEDLIEHSVTDLLKQRVFALALGYEDLNDHDQLRTDPLLATLVGKRDVTGAERVDPAIGASRWPARARSIGWNLRPRGPASRAATRRSSRGRTTSRPGSSRPFCSFSRSRRQRSCSTWMPPTIRFTASKRADSSTAITKAIAICRCTSSAASTCCWRSCGPRTSTRRPAA